MTVDLMICTPNAPVTLFLILAYFITSDFFAATMNALRDVQCSTLNCTSIQLSTPLASPSLIFTGALINPLSLPRALQWYQPYPASRCRYLNATLSIVFRTYSTNCDLLRLNDHDFKEHVILKINSFGQLVIQEGSKSTPFIVNYAISDGVFRKIQVGINFVLILSMNGTVEYRHSYSNSNRAYRHKANCPPPEPYTIEIGGLGFAGCISSVMLDNLAEVNISSYRNSSLLSHGVHLGECVPRCVAKDIGEDICANQGKCVELFDKQADFCDCHDSVFTGDRCQIDFGYDQHVFIEFSQPLALRSIKFVVDLEDLKNLGNVILFDTKAEVMNRIIIFCLQRSAETHIVAHFGTAFSGDIKLEHVTNLTTLLITVDIIPLESSIQSQFNLHFKVNNKESKTMIADDAFAVTGLNFGGIVQSQLLPNTRILYPYQHMEFNVSTNLHFGACVSNMEIRYVQGIHTERHYLNEDFLRRVAAGEIKNVQSRNHLVPSSMCHLGKLLVEMTTPREEKKVSLSDDISHTLSADRKDYLMTPASAQTAIIVCISFTVLIICSLAITYGVKYRRRLNKKRLHPEENGGKHFPLHISQSKFSNFSTMTTPSMTAAYTTNCDTVTTPLQTPNNTSPINSINSNYSQITTNYKPAYKARSLLMKDSSFIATLDET